MVNNKEHLLLLFSPNLHLYDTQKTLIISLLKMFGMVKSGTKIVTGCPFTKKWSIKNMGLFGDLTIKNTAERQFFNKSCFTAVWKKNYNKIIMLWILGKMQLIHFNYLPTVLSFISKRNICLKLTHNYSNQLISKHLYAYTYQVQISSQQFPGRGQKTDSKQTKAGTLSATAAATATFATTGWKSTAKKKIKSSNTTSITSKKN